MRSSYFPVLFLSNGISIRRQFLHKRLIKNPSVAPGAEVSCWFHVTPLTPPPADALSQSCIGASSARHGTHTGFIYHFLLQGEINHGPTNSAECPCNNWSVTSRQSAVSQNFKVYHRARQRMNYRPCAFNELSFLRGCDYLVEFNEWLSPDGTRAHCGFCKARPSCLGKITFRSSACCCQATAAQYACCLGKTEMINAQGGSRHLSESYPLLLLTSSWVPRVSSINQTWRNDRQNMVLFLDSRASDKRYEK